MNIKEITFKKIENLAYKIKFLVQMLIGFSVFSILCYSFSIELKEIIYNYGNHNLELKYPLGIVSYGLGISAGIEMAYMLFTPGPDEAVEPIILGLASTLLYILSIIDLSNTAALIQYSVLIVSLAITIGGLFFIKERFVNISKIEEQNHE